MFCKFNSLLVAISIFMSLLGCSLAVQNATCYSSSNGIFAVRTDGDIPIAMMLFAEKNFAPLKVEMEFFNNGEKIAFKKLIRSSLLLNENQVKGQPCRWGPIKAGVWPNGTTEYNFGEFTLWVNDDAEIISIRIMVEGLKLSNEKLVKIKGKSVSRYKTADFKSLLGKGAVKETRYFSVF